MTQEEVGDDNGKQQRTDASGISKRTIRQRILRRGVFRNKNGDFPEPPHVPPKPRRWLFDRANGTSKYGTTRPPHPICYVPFPVKWWPDFLEQNCLCERLGRIGAVKPDNVKLRVRLLRLGLSANIISFCLSLFACVAISTDFDVLRASSYSFARVTSDEVDLPDTFIDVGLRAVALENVPPFGTDDVISYDAFCNSLGTGLFLYLDPDRCEWCEDVSWRLIFSLSLSLLGYIPTLLTDVLRQYKNYDVNCQKVFAGFFALISLGLALRTWLVYERGCYEGFYAGDVYFEYNGTDFGPPSAVEEESDTTVLVHFDWKKGPGLFALQISGLLKIVDIVVNLAVPTPSITRDHEEQETYEELYGERAHDDDHSAEEAIQADPQEDN